METKETKESKETEENPLKVGGLYGNEAPDATDFGRQIA